MIIILEIFTQNILEMNGVPMKVIMIYAVNKQDFNDIDWGEGVLLNYGKRGNNNNKINY